MLHLFQGKIKSIASFITFLYRLRNMPLVQNNKEKVFKCIALATR